MLSRLNIEKLGTPLPEDFLAETKSVLERVFKSFLEKENLDLFFYGEQFANEIYFATTITPINTPSSPLSFFISIDKPKKQDDKTFSKMIDSLGFLMEKYFEAGSTWDETFDLWTQADSSGLSFYYKVNRESVKLTLEADRLLNEDKV